MSGALAAIGRAGQNHAPLNLVGDYGGGSLLGSGNFSWSPGNFEIGKGQVVDAAMVDGASSLMAHL